MVEEVGQTTQEKEVPEYNILQQDYANLFYRLGTVTHQSVSRKDGNEIERSLLLRAHRADLLERFKATPKKDKEERLAIIAEARDRDEIARQFLDQGELSIDLPGLGEQKARYTVINPPEGRKRPEQESKPPVFIIPGSSNDLDSHGALAQEIAFLGRKVILVAYPESQFGYITSEFAEKAVESETFQPHVTFFKQAIRKFFKEGESLELWGFSTGAPIAAELLTDPEFQKQTKNAVFISPAGTANQSLTQFRIGTASEIKNLIRNYKNLPKLSLVFSRKEPDKPGQEDLKSKVWKSLFNKILSVGDSWKEARVREGGKIVVFSGKKDRMTKSSLGEKELSENPQIEIISDPKASHATPLLEPNRVVQKIFDTQKS